MTTAPKLQHSMLETDDFEALQEAAPGWDQEYSQMSPGKFSGRLELTEVGSTQVMRERWNRKVMFQGTGATDGFGFALTLGAANPAKWLGSPVGSDSVVCQAPDREADLLSGETWDSLVFSFGVDDARAVVSALSGGRDLADGFHGQITLQPENADRIKRAGLKLLEDTKSCSDDDWARYALQVEQFKKQFLWHLVEAIDASSVPPSNRAAIVRRATDLVFAAPGEIVGLTDICSRLGISLRSLHYAFRDVAGMSPATWLRRIRLNRVHRLLKQMTPDETRIKRLAAENGFVHLGHFSNQYQRLFGYLPSQTFREK